MSPRRHPPLLLVALWALTGCDCGGGDGFIDPDKSNARSVLCVPPFTDAGATVLASGLDGPRKLATDGEALYFTVRGAFGSGEVRRTSLYTADAGSLPLASGLDSPDAIAVDEAHVYFTDDTGVWRVEKAGGAPQLLVDLANNALVGDTTVVVDGDHLIVATGLEWLARVHKREGSTVLLHTAPAGTTVKAATLDRGEVYFLVSGGGDQADAGGIYRLPSAGGTAVQVWDQPKLGRTLALTPDDFVWSEGTSLQFSGAVKSRPRTQRDAGVLLHGERLWAPSALAVAAPYVFFTARTQGPAREFLLRGSGGCDDGGVTPVGPEGIGPGAVLLFDGGLYFSSAGISGEGYVGRIP